MPVSNHLRAAYLNEKDVATDFIEDSLFLEGCVHHISKRNHKYVGFYHDCVLLCSYNSDDNSMYCRLSPAHAMGSIEDFGVPEQMNHAEKLLLAFMDEPSHQSPNSENGRTIVVRVSKRAPYTYRFDFYFRPEA